MKKEMKTFKIFIETLFLLLKIKKIYLYKVVYRKHILQNLVSCLCKFVNVIYSRVHLPINYN